MYRHRHVHRAVACPAPLCGRDPQKTRTDLTPWRFRLTRAGLVFKKTWTIFPQDRPGKKIAHQMHLVGVTGLLFCGGIHCRGQAVLLAFQPLTWSENRQAGWRSTLCLGHHPAGRTQLAKAALTDQLSNGPLGPLF